MENKSSLTFSFCGDYEVNALSLSRAITSLVELSSAVAEREFPNVEFRMNVRAVTPGSLKFDFVAVALAAQTLLSHDTIEYAANLIGVVASTFSIKKFLKGKRPQRRETFNDHLVITNTDGDRLEVPVSAGVYFVDNRVDKSITNIINSAKASNGVTGISIDAGGRVEIPRDDFEQCSKELDIEMCTSAEEPIVTLRPKEVLFIRQADFSGELKWRFKSAGAENVVASISDERFIDRVKSGVQEIRAKMYLIADVRVTVHLGLDGLPDESKCTYEVLKIHSVGIPGEGQTKFDI